MIVDANRQNTQSDFQLIDAETRQDLASRREIKYGIPRTDVGKLQRLLETNCKRLVHNNQVSAVRSIYFDDPALGACRANLNGLSSRRKLRLRWYDSLQPGSHFFVEIKWRDNRLTGKHRLEMRSPVPLCELSYREILENIEPHIPDHLMRYLIAYCEPIVIVEYQREHFATNDGLRLTLDYDLTYYDQTSRERVWTGFPRRVDGIVVLEGKTPIGRESEIPRWLHPFSPRATRFSKYVIGCNQIGLIGDGEM